MPEEDLEKKIEIWRRALESRGIVERRVAERKPEPKEELKIERVSLRTKPAPVPPRNYLRVQCTVCKTEFDIPSIMHPMRHAIFGKTVATCPVCKEPRLVRIRTSIVSRTGRGYILLAAAIFILGLVILIGALL